MQKSLFGLLTAFIAVICFLCAMEAFRKKRYGLGALFLINVFTNLVNSIHAFSGLLF